MHLLPLGKKPRSVQNYVSPRISVVPHLIRDLHHPHRVSNAIESESTSMLYPSWQNLDNAQYCTAYHLLRARSSELVAVTFMCSRNVP